MPLLIGWNSRFSGKFCHEKHEKSKKPHSSVYASSSAEYPCILLESGVEPCGNTLEMIPINNDGVTDLVY